MGDVYPYIEFFFKPNPGTENYVIEHLPVNVRRVVAGLRMGCLPLEVETGRYVGTPYDQRICKHCKNAPEDREHFLLICPALADLQNALYSTRSQGCIQTFLLLKLQRNCTTSCVHKPAPLDSATCWLLCI